MNSTTCLEGWCRSVYFDEGMREKRFLHFFTVTLIFGL